MYGLPKNIDLDFLKDKKLIQVCISANQIILRFDEDISISIESVVKLLNSSGERYSYDDVSSINKDFLELIEKTIVNIMCYVNGNLILQFENGSKVELTDDSPNYESYQILRNGKIIVIV